MNWGSVKNLLIAMLIVANLFLVYNISVQNRNQGYLDDAEIQAAVELLAQRGLSVDANGIPRKKLSAEIFESAFTDAYYDSVSERLSLSTRESRNILPDGGVRIVTENGSAFEFDGKLGFTYTRDSKIEAAAYTGITAENFGESSDLYGELGKTRISVYTKKAAEFLGAGLSDEYPFGVQPDGGFYNPDDGYTYILVAQQLDGLPIYGHRVICVFDEEALISVYGSWYFGGTDASYTNELYDQVNILFIDLETLGDRIGLASAASGNSLPGVSSVTACYAIYFSADKTAVYFIPAWQVLHTDATVLVYNAYSGAAS